jgi:hypothetical protein
MRKVIFLIGLCLTLISVAAKADSVPSYVSRYVKDAAPVGEGRMSYMFWELYDATLYASQGEFKKGKPFALSLKYLRPIEGRKIADTSAEEIRRQGRANEYKIAAWHEQMRRIFPDVNEQTTLTGIYQPGRGVTFYQNDVRVGVIQDDEFGKNFFDIWLGPQTRAPDLRRALMGA